jgi:hypothetical protein
MSDIGTGENIYRFTERATHESFDWGNDRVIFPFPHVPIFSRAGACVGPAHIPAPAPNFRIRYANKCIMQPIRARPFTSL